MKVFSFEVKNSYQEFYTLRSVKKAALEKAAELGTEVLVTCMHKPSYRMDWFTALPDGRWLTDLVGYRADN